MCGRRGGAPRGTMSLPSAPNSGVPVIMYMALDRGHYKPRSWSPYAATHSTNWDGISTDDVWCGRCKRWGDRARGACALRLPGITGFDQRCFKFINGGIARLRFRCGMRCGHTIQSCRHEAEVSAIRQQQQLRWSRRACGDGSPLRHARITSRNLLHPEIHAHDDERDNDTS